MTDTLNGSFQDYLEILKRRGRLLLLTTAVLMVIGVAVIFALPPSYRSQAVILIEQQEIPPDLVRSTITSFADQRIQVTSQRVMTRSNLLGIISKYDLYAEERQHESTEAIVEMMRKHINMETLSADVVDPRSGRPTQATIAFTVSYDSESPQLAQKVANELVSLYLNENLKSRTQMVTDTTEFLSAESERLADEISKLEASIASFKEKNIGMLPELMDLNFSSLERTDREILEINNQLQALQERKIYLQAEISQLDPYLGAFGEDGERILSNRDRLRVVQSKLLSARANYAENHPTVLRLQREVNLLSRDVENSEEETKSELRANIDSKKSELLKLKEKYTESHPDVSRLERELAELQAVQKRGYVTSSSQKLKHAPDNPAYISLKAELESTVTAIDSLLKTKNDLQTKLTKFEDRLVGSPQVEKTYRGLSRDYETAVGKYQELRVKLREAELAKVLEADRKGERFTLIEPPQLPQEPYKPNRWTLAVVGAVMASAGGVGSMVLSESLDTSIRTPRALAALTGQLPLTTIPTIETKIQRQYRRRRRIYWVVACGAILILILTAIHLWLKPLDVIWYMATKRWAF